jgi:hypothetical protein
MERQVPRTRRSNTNLVDVLLGAVLAPASGLRSFGGYRMRGTM